MNIALLWGCAGASPGVQTTQTEPRAMKMRHQILFSHSGEDHVFEGYLLVHGSALLVKAFAGPGVDLFTVVRNGKQHREELHLQGLEKKMDLVAVGADIARVYLGGCGGGGQGDQVTCDFFGEQMVEIYGANNRLTARRFPEAYRVGLHIQYSQYTSKSGRMVPQKITLTWGDGDTRMEIRLLSFEVLDDVDPTLFDL